ncbi:MULTISPECIES: FAD/NAD(P)-binding protein [Mycolicibacterium]|jgi:cation diffusion facilitator CzcD-associated flavoprotein CzcO|uniref:FAD dependent oxidoreductase n=2 Tax=Mycolicibacterium TaxID=1866885 RepID=A1T9V4_MYCVP|nr:MULTISPECIES: NAD(P)/FAD-dependent oxidoreductase [Mycolicibacterium]ABM13954.1 FAD dependent oxidoreductase [Mycolicibacterium vanbaalenii PYR-1]MCV7129537.1 NAD(P)/FAD-dependent oxidoreductase [Mycolicibacterium vanbaalenii PYR-1]MDN4518706.1 NAD(P)/FAD-dependent oxidoreductase [Mycolicibacterium austroafricanum]MDW5609978.1 NAD(P)/FAD-dependent oxidoreductase [Mycolicibacterium sp. D5.8-2]PQP46002.1 NAD(P)/FAD-dependent oxidoreductase [Mycolicibacterium austroafricanum]
MTALDALAERVRRELELTAYPRPQWLTSRQHDGEPVVDVLIVGGGQAGLTVAFALKRRAITNTVILESAPAGAEGPWTTYAAMHTLRTPKGLTGPDQGLPALTPESWYRAAHGDDAWEAIQFIPKEHWQDYLVWFRAATEPRMRNDVAVTGIRDAGDGVLEVSHTGGRTFARRVVLATGMAGNGEWSVPPVIRAALPPQRYVHTGAPVDFRRFAGQRVGVLGGGASAFDYGASALEHGAASVDLFYRRAQVPRVNPFRWMEFYAFGAHFPDLPDEDKWKFTVQFARTNQPPPQQTWYRCTRWDTFAWHTAADWSAVRMDGDEIVVRAGADEFRFDAVISGTGPNVDLAARPELRDLAGRVAVWADRFTAPAGWEDNSLLGYPYLGPGFEFTERDRGSAPWLSRVHDFTYGARLSMGLNGNMNSGLGAGGRRLADALSRALFLEDRHRLFASYQDYDVAELVDLGRPADRVGMS